MYNQYFKTEVFIVFYVVVRGRELMRIKWELSLPQVWNSGQGHDVEIGQRSSHMESSSVWFSASFPQQPAENALWTDCFSTEAIIPLLYAVMETCCCYWVTQGKICVQTSTSFLKLTQEPKEVSWDVSPTHTQRTWSSWAIRDPGGYLNSGEISIILKPFCFC